MSRLSAALRTRRNEHPGHHAARLGCGGVIAPG
jgi:hypothetical protein